MPVLIAEFDAERRFTFANATYETWLGIDPKAMLGERLADVGRIDFFASREANLERAYQGQRVSFEQRAALAGGLRHLQTTYIPRLDADGGRRRDLRAHQRHQ